MPSNRRSRYHMPPPPYSSSAPQRLPTDHRNGPTENDRISMRMPPPFTPPPPPPPPRPQPYADYGATRTTTIPISRPEYNSGTRLKEFAYLTFIIMLFFGFVFFQYSSMQTAWENERKQHAAERQTWELERLEQERERLAFEGERTVWDREREEQAAQRHSWMLERAEQDRERAVFEEERAEWERQRQSHHPFWGTPSLETPSCLAYNTRRYKARLWNVQLGSDWHAACLKTPIQIHGRELTSPERCDARGDHVYGFWRVDYEEPSCQPRWGDVTWDKGCIRPGIHVIEAPLWGQKPGDDIYSLCMTTPGKLSGDWGMRGHPTYCERKGDLGMVGRWEFRDDNCR